jgi:hypothetical protein
VSTLAPLFAAAFATHNTWATFLVGLAAAVGAGISMGFAEALSDDGSLTGRGAPLMRGAVCGLMTAVGGLGHTLPYLIPHFYAATVLAIVVVVIELAVISWIRTRYMDTPFLQAAFQVMVGGALVLATARPRHRWKARCPAHDSRIIMRRCSCSPTSLICISQNGRGSSNLPASAGLASSIGIVAASIFIGSKCSMRSPTI